jgi:hypothetical protein
MTNTSAEPPNVTALVNRLALTASDLAQHEDIADPIGSEFALYTLASALDCLRRPVGELLRIAGDDFNCDQVDQALASAAAEIRRASRHEGMTGTLEPDPTRAPMNSYAARRMAEDRYPHHFYADTIANHLRYRLRADLTKWWTDEADDRTLAICYLFRVPTPEGQPTEGPLLSASAEAWSSGVEVHWDQTRGWWYVPVDDYPPLLPPEPSELPVPVLASPQALAALLPNLLTGDWRELPASTQEWEYAEQLCAALDARTPAR